MAGPRIARRGGGLPGRSAALGLGLVLGLVALALLAPWLLRGTPEAMDLGAILRAPDPGHPFGTDNFGRDVLVRAVYGLRVSLLVAAGAVGLALLLGVPLGLAAGYWGGWVDALVMRPADAVMAFPAIVLVVAVAGLAEPGIGIMAGTIGLVYVPILVRVMRGAALEVSAQLYVEGARARGASDLRVMLRHVLPNALGPVLVQASALMGLAILMEAALSFIGLGVQPPTPSLGLMLAEGRQYMVNAPWLVICPGLGIVLIVLGFNLLGDGLPRLLGTQGRGR